MISVLLGSIGKRLHCYVISDLAVTCRYFPDSVIGHELHDCMVMLDFRCLLWMVCEPACFCPACLLRSINMEHWEYHGFLFIEFTSYLSQGTFFCISPNYCWFVCQTVPTLISAGYRHKVRMVKDPLKFDSTSYLCIYYGSFYAVMFYMCK